MSRSPLVVLFCISFVCFSLSAPTSTRIVGGFYAKDGQFAHQVSIRIYPFRHCGGSIISRIFILTAAHCVTDFNNKGELIRYPASSLAIWAGSIDRFRGGVLMRVAEVIVHENYGPFLKNDIALLQLAENIIFSPTIQPIRLASAEVPIGSKVIISGWGLERNGGRPPQYLKWNEVSVVTKDYVGRLFLGHQIGNGACYGDSGGPAVYNGEIIGITSSLYTYCGSMYPDGYSNVFYYRNWIKRHANLM